MPPNESVTEVPPTQASEQSLDGLLLQEIPTGLLEVAGVAGMIPPTDATLSVNTWLQVKLTAPFGP